MGRIGLGLGLGRHRPRAVAAPAPSGPQTIFLTATGAGTWTVPAYWNSANNTIHCIGGSGAIYDDRVDDNGPYGGAGGGAYSGVSNLALTAGETISFSVGAGGSKAGAVDGGDSWFNGADFAGASVGAKGGHGAGNGGTSAGGSAAAGIGTTKFSGGAGNNSGTGGGAGGPAGNGVNGSSGTTGGAGNAGAAGGGGGGTQFNPGAAGTLWTQTSDGATAGPGGGAGFGGGVTPRAGGLYGGAPGSISGDGRDGINGSQGIIVITYTP